MLGAFLYGIGILFRVKMVRWSIPWTMMWSGLTWISKWTNSVFKVGRKLVCLFGIIFCVQDLSISCKSTRYGINLFALIEVELNVFWISAFSLHLRMAFAGVRFCSLQHHQKRIYFRLVQYSNFHVFGHLIKNYFTF